MFAVAANALYTTLRRRGTTRQLAVVIVICVISALLLLPAIIWYSLRFSVQMAMIPIAEVEVMLVYIALCGWVVPLGVTCSYVLFTVPRTTTTSVHIPRQQQTKHGNRATKLQPPRHQAGVLAPFVFNADTPWGWLEYGSGSFHGQRLELKRAIATIGRDEDSDIWIDDEMASRHHVELACDQGNVYITDCGSLNGVLLNGQRVTGSALLESNDVLEIGAHRFIFISAERRGVSAEQDDPLLNHKWVPRRDTLPPVSSDLPTTSPLEDSSNQLSFALSSRKGQWEETAQIDHAFPLSLPTDQGGALTICGGEMMGQRFLLNRSIVTFGRAAECDVAINDFSISRWHTQFSRQSDGDYVQDMGSRNGTKVNNEPLMSPRLLQSGDIVSIGNICMKYALVHMTRSTSQNIVTTPQLLIHPGPTLLRLPSKQKR